MGRRRDGNYSPQKNNSIQDSVGKEENGYPVPHLNKTMINVTKEPSDTHIKTLKEEILEDVTGKFMETILDIVNQNVQDAFKKYQDTKNKEHEKTQKQIKELREGFNEHQSETKDNIKREIYELKMTIENIKEELNKDRENFRQKNQTEILEIKIPFSQTKNIVEDHSSRIEQVEKRISEFEDKIELKEETSVKQLKSCERNMQ
jgi:predicted RNase H-like nuclease (RuvC/YqgF family)